MRARWILVAFLAFLAWGAPGGSAPAVAASSPSPTPAPVTVTLFHGEGCPHCAAERAFLGQLALRHPDLVIEEYEVWSDEANRELLRTTAQRLGFEPSGVPVTVLGDRVWIGFDEITGREIETAVTGALGASATPAASGPSPPAAGRELQVPLVGAVDVGGVSLLVSTLAIGFVDGVNPCSLWVLSLLLAMVLNRGSRGRVILVGTTFLVVTAAMYALYIAGMYSALDYVSELGWIRLVVAATAGVFGVLQFKDGLGISHGPSLSISSSRRPGIFARMRAVAAPDRGIAVTLAGTVVLAVGVSLLETPCTAGLPLLWTSLLAEQDVGLLQATALFGVYMTVFLLDELVVFGLAVLGLRALRLQERQGRLLKLLAGSVLVTLAVTMLVHPTALATVTGTLIVFAIAGIVAAAAYLLTRTRARGTTRRDPPDRGTPGPVPRSQPPPPSPAGTRDA